MSSANIVRGGYSGNSRGLGFVKMGGGEDAQGAIKKLGGVEIGGRNIVVQQVKPRRKHDMTHPRSFLFRGRGIL